jgi:hypothetical protein
MALNVTFVELNFREKFGAEDFDHFLKGHLTCGLSINDLWKDFKRGRFKTGRLEFREDLCTYL